MPHEPPGGNPPMPDPADVPRLLREQLRSKYPNVSAVEQLRPLHAAAAAGLPGWPYPPDGPHAAALAAELARRMVRDINGRGLSAEVSRRLGEVWVPELPSFNWKDYLSPAERAWAEAERASQQRARDAQVGAAAEAWCEVLAEAFGTQAVRSFRAAYGRRPNGDDPEDVIVGGLVRDRMPLVIGGATKAMKTGLSIDLAAAVVTGTPFLNMPVPRPRPVAVLTLETSCGDWWARFARAVAARGGDFGEAERSAFVADRRELLTRGAAREEFTNYLLAAHVGVVIIDPLYLALPTRNTADLSACGKALRHLCKPITDGDATPVVLHHATKDCVGLPTLADLSGAGVGPWARSWLLVGREDEYHGGGVHNLLAQVGTSWGDHAEMRVRFDEVNWKITTRPGLSDPPRAEPSPRRGKVREPKFLTTEGA